MKKSFPSVLLVVFCVAALSAQVPSQSTAQQPPPKPEDVQKNLVLVEKPQAVPDKMKTGFETITAKDALAMLTYLSSDLMEGRETATRGYQLASEYAASLFALWGLKPGGDQPGMGGAFRMGMFGGGRSQRPAPAEKSYLQEMAIKEITDTTTDVSVEIRSGGLTRTRSFQSGVDYMGMYAAPDTISAPVVFAGYGIVEKDIAWDDFKNLDVKGKIVMVLSEAPGKDNPNSPFQQKNELKEKYFPAGPAMFMRRGGFNKTQEITKLGAAAILQVQASLKDSDMYRGLAGPRPVNDERPIINEPRRQMSLPGVTQRMPWEGSPVITISHEMADAVLQGSGQKIEDLQKKIDTSLKPASLELPGTRLNIATASKTTLVRSANVVGYIEGSDPKLKDEVVVVGAHLDHLGKRGDYIYNGADDNGSGSVGVLALARAFALNQEKPKRTVVFALWTGEEEGLLGSRYYVLNPAFPMTKTIAYLNMDMISRPYTEENLKGMGRMMNLPTDSEAFKKIKVANFLPVSFSAGAGIADVIRDADQYVGLDLYLRESGGGMDRAMGGSDHSSFASANVPWVFVITSLHEEYHQTGDSVEKVSGDMLAKIARLIYISAYAEADK
jgi:Peptidase family M28